MRDGESEVTVGLSIEAARIDPDMEVEAIVAEPAVEIVGV
jgi:hypothetical protein